MGTETPWSNIGRDHTPCLLGSGSTLVAGSQRGRRANPPTTHPQSQQPALCTKPGWSTEQERAPVGTPVQEPSRSEAPTRSPDLKSSHPTGLLPTPEQVTTRWKRAWRTSFYCGRAASTLQAPPGYQTLHLEGPNLYSRAKNHVFPSHPRPTRPLEARRNVGLSGWSTSFSHRLRSRREKEREAA